ncbi:hypothetical protein ACJX0J_038994, partial [Zea mays]
MAHAGDIAGGDDKWQDAGMFQFQSSAKGRSGLHAREHMKQLINNLITNYRGTMKENTRMTNLPFYIAMFADIKRNVEAASMHTKGLLGVRPFYNKIHFYFPLNVIIDTAASTEFFYFVSILQHVLIDLPGLAFFTTYALLVLFWAEIYYQARAVSTDGLRPAFYTINGMIYVIQILLWLLMWWKPVQAVVILSKMFFAATSLFAAFGFLLYGGRLFLMLQRFPVESKGRRKKLNEVGYVTTICFGCFLIRCIMMCLSAFNKDADLDVLNHPILNFFYYL